jgi:hypothetical protein
MSRGKKKQLHPVEEQANTIASVTQDAPAEQLTDEQVLDVTEEVFRVETGEPTCPFPGDPSMGDKDPEVVAWYRDNAPEEFARRYANRIVPQSLPEPRIESGPPRDFDDEEEPVKKPNVITQ